GNLVVDAFEKWPAAVEINERRKSKEGVEVPAKSESRAQAKQALDQWRQGEHRNCKNHRNPESAAEIGSHRRVVVAGVAVPHVVMSHMAMRDMAHLRMSVLPMTCMLTRMLIHLVVHTAPGDLLLREHASMPATAADRPNFKLGPERI